MYAQATKLFTIRRTLLKMLARRMYTLPASLTNETPESFNELYAAHVARRRQAPDGGGGGGGGGSKKKKSSVSSVSVSSSSAAATPLDALTFVVSRDGAPTPAPAHRKLMVFFPNDSDRSNLGISPIREFVSCMKAHACAHAILVVFEGLTSPAVFMLRDLEAQHDIHITFFAEKELLYDIFEHKYVPRHELLDEAEKQRLAQELKVATLDLLPHIQKHDPVARYMGLAVGDVVRIHRFSATVGRDVYYRVVVDSEDFD